MGNNISVHPIHFYFKVPETEKCLRYHNMFLEVYGIYTTLCNSVDSVWSSRKIRKMNQST